jgi:hypothetical protein
MIGVGFSEATVLDMSSMLGWFSGTWGYHNDDGKLYGESSLPGRQFGELYQEDDIIGCGVNFEDETAFYTKNGKFIGTLQYTVSPTNKELIKYSRPLGRAFQNVRGRLYPAVSLTRGCVVSVELWDDKQTRNEKFRFKGSYNE